jgi:YidC/Oxa1 family membrane protein insertase
MQKIAPQVQSINDKYKKYSLKDPRRADAQKEISALYKEHDVNPAGGCLPLIIQMPFLFAFWAMLSAAIELRGAQWLWLKDLAQPDKLYLIPIIIIVSTMFMQRMTPQAGMNPEQAKMMNMMMPLMLGFMSWSVASGLGLYWLTGTIVAIAQQWGMNQTALGREIRAIQEKRAAKQLKK